MSWWPGWESIASTTWWSNFYFWASIIALISLGIFEVISHRYSERKDELVAVEQAGVQRRHDEDMTRVQHDAAQAVERAATLEKDAATARVLIADANVRAAEATQKAAEAQLALEQFKAPRWISDAHRDVLVQLLKKIKDVSVDVFLIHAPTSDAAPLAGRLLSILQAAEWRANGVFNLMGGPMGAGIMIATRQNPSHDDQMAATALLSELNAMGLSAAPDNIVTDSAVAVLGAFAGPNVFNPPANLWIIIGSKP